MRLTPLLLRQHGFLLHTAPAGGEGRAASGGKTTLLIGPRPGSGFPLKCLAPEMIGRRTPRLLPRGLDARRRRCYCCETLLPTRNRSDFLVGQGVLAKTDRPALIQTLLQHHLPTPFHRIDRREQLIAAVAEPDRLVVRDHPLRLNRQDGL